MNKWLFSLLLLVGASAFMLRAQQIAVTADGRQVVLYDDGTWRYWPDRNLPWPGGDCDEFYPDCEQNPIFVAPSAEGFKVRLTFNNDVVFVIERGKLVDFYPYTPWSKQYTPQKRRNRVQWVGRHKVKYTRRFDQELVERVGPYAIKYDGFGEKVTRIGDIAIDYEPFSECIRRIGSTELKYSLWKKILEDVKEGRDAGLRIYLY